MDLVQGAVRACCRWQALPRCARCCYACDAPFLRCLFRSCLCRGWRRLQMALCLYVGNAIKDLVCAPRPLGVAYGRERLKFLGGSDTEALVNSKVLQQMRGSVRQHVAAQASAPGCACPLGDTCTHARWLPCCTLEGWCQTLKPLPAQRAPHAPAGVRAAQLPHHELHCAQLLHHLLPVRERPALARRSRWVTAPGWGLPGHWGNAHRVGSRPACYNRERKRATPPAQCQPLAGRPPSICSAQEQGLPSAGAAYALVAFLVVLVAISRIYLGL